MATMRVFAFFWVLLPCANAWWWTTPDSSCGTDETMYDVLGVSRDPSEQALKESYRRLAREWHPDKNLHRSEEATRRFAAVSRAYGVLSDPVQRRIYDILGDDGLQRWQDGDPSIDAETGREIVRDKRVYTNEPPPPPKGMAAPGWDSMDDFITSLFAWLERRLMGP